MNAPSVRSTAAPNLLRINLVGLWTIVRKESRRVVRIWIQTIVPPAITMTLYFIIFGSLVGSRIGNMDGVPYMTFIAPGLIMMAVITNSFANVVSSFFSSKLMLHLEEAESLCRNIAIIDEGRIIETTAWPTSSASCSSRCSC